MRLIGCSLTNLEYRLVWFKISGFADHGSCFDWKVVHFIKLAVCLFERFVRRRLRQAGMKY